jgi:1-acyl-sn-glycerol-3-phosphate acyltransferase
VGKLDRMGSTTLRIWRLAAFFVWTVLAMPVQGVGLLLHRSWTATFPCFFHRRCCRILGLKVRRIGHPVSARPVLFACNHVSYIDIIVLGSVIPGSFISKAEVARWPLLGWLAKLQRSVFVDRKVSSTARQRDAIAERLAAKDALILFPEGTSGDGNHVLPFKSSLFSVVFDRKIDEPIVVQPVSVAYTRLDGLPMGRRLRPFFAWYGDMSFGSHVWHAVGLGTIEVVVEFHASTTVAEWESRKALSQFCHERISNGVARLLAGRAPVSASPRTRRRPISTDVPAPVIG